MESEILAIHRAYIEAHLNHDVDFFVRDFPEDFVSISRGEISHPTREEFEAMLSRYLNNVTFSEYRDLCEPTVRFSKDGTLAWLTMQVKVTGTLKHNETEYNLDDVWAGMMLYEKRAGKWVWIAEVSNFKPAPRNS
jgi:hypothetical protein